MDKMRELVQQSASSSTELSAAAEQMLKLSRNLLDTMDRFVIDRAHPAATQPRHSTETASCGVPRIRRTRYAELTRS